MKLRLTIIFLSISIIALSQTIGTIYLFPGQGSDRRIFDSISFDSKFEVRIIEYGTPDKEMTLKSFARQLSNQIDTTQNFILIGVSFGGMICVEMSEILNPRKTIIISSAKNCRELPFRYRFQKVIPIYKLIPKGMILAGAKILQPIVEPDRNNNKLVFKSMLSSKSGLYMKRAVGLIINWDRKENSKNVFHIHGTNDRTIPIRRIVSPTIVVEEGSHMITLTRGKEISEHLKSVINE